jgi:hypothetical protein
MNPSRRGLGTAGKAGAVIVMLVIVLGTLYLLPRYSSSSQSQPATSNAVPEKITGMPSLFYDFTGMQVSAYINDPADDFVQNQSYTYTVLGTAKLNSTLYTRVEYTTVGVGNDVIVWYNSTGGINEVEVVGVRTYTGNGTRNLPFITTYTGLFGSLVSVTDNDTLLSLLSKTSDGTAKIGATQMDVSTYMLYGRLYPYSSLTLKVATIPGTSVQLVTYLDEATAAGTSSLLRVTSLTR